MHVYNCMWKSSFEVMCWQLLEIRKEASIYFILLYRMKRRGRECFVFYNLLCYIIDNCPGKYSIIRVFILLWNFFVCQKYQFCWCNIRLLRHFAAERPARHEKENASFSSYRIYMTPVWQEKCFSRDFGLLLREVPSFWWEYHWLNK